MQTVLPALVVFLSLACLAVSSGQEPEGAAPGATENATEPSDTGAKPADAPPAETADPANSVQASEFADAVCDRVMADLAQLHLPYVTEKEAGVLRGELHHCLAKRMKHSPAEPSRGELLAAVDAFVARNFAGPDGYLHFRKNFLMLGWRIWAASERRNLSEAEAARRDEQRAWMRDFLSKAADDQPNPDRRALLVAVQLRALEFEVLSDPLSPVFDEPMSAEQFAGFCKRLEGLAFGARSADAIFRCGLTTRAEELKQRWPPGFACRDCSTQGRLDFAFGGEYDEFGAVVSLFVHGKSLSLFSIEDNRAVHESAKSREAAMAWLAQTRRGDLWFDPDNNRIFVMRGTKMAALKETEWYRLDRIPLADLRQLLRERPIGSMSLAKLPDPTIADFQTLELAIAALPTLVLETKEGHLALVRVRGYGQGGVTLQVRHRPLPPNPPFHTGDDEYDEAPMRRATADQLVTAMSDRFSAALKKQNLPFITPEVLMALRSELFAYLDDRVRVAQGPKRHGLMLKAIDNFVARNFADASCYLRFRNDFDSLKWQLWTTTEHRELTGQEATQRSLQMAWTRDYVRRQPVQPGRGKGDARFLLGMAAPHEEKLKELERDVFNNPLCPFWCEPMTSEEFEAYKARLDASSDLDSAPQRVFFAVAYARAPALTKRWPLGFAMRGIHLHGTSDFDFRSAAPDGEFHWHSGGGRSGMRLFLDAANNDVVEQAPPLDGEATERWLQGAKKGDLWFDAATGRLIAVRGARLTTLAETEWYAVDRISLNELRKRLTEAPLEAFALDTLTNRGVRTAKEIDAAIAALPTLVLETAEGEIVVLRVEGFDAHGVMLWGRPRPLPPYPPLHPGDQVKPSGDELAE